MSGEVYIIEEDKQNKGSELILRSNICMYPPIYLSVYPAIYFCIHLSIYLCIQL